MNINCNRMEFIYHEGVLSAGLLAVEVMREKGTECIRSAQSLEAFEEAHGQLLQHSWSTLYT